MDSTLKVNDQTEETVYFEDITEETRPNPDKLDEEASVNPEGFPRNKVDINDQIEEPVCDEDMTEEEGANPDNLDK